MSLLAPSGLEATIYYLPFSNPALYTAVNSEAAQLCSQPSVCVESAPWDKEILMVKKSLSLSFSSQQSMLVYIPASKLQVRNKWQKNAQWVMSCFSSIGQCFNSHEKHIKFTSWFLLKLISQYRWGWSPNKNSLRLRPWACCEGGKLTATPRTAAGMGLTDTLLGISYVSGNKPAVASPLRTDPVVSKRVLQGRKERALLGLDVSQRICHLS